MFHKNILQSQIKEVKMRIYILSRNEELYSTRRLVEEANLKGWK